MKISFSACIMISTTHLSLLLHDQACCSDRLRLEMQWNQIEFKFAEIETTPNVRSSGRPLYGGFINHNQRSLPGHVLPPLDFLKTSHREKFAGFFGQRGPHPCCTRSWHCIGHCKQVQLLRTSPSLFFVREGSFNGRHVGEFILDPPNE